MIFRLTLPGRIIEDGREKAKFDIDKGRSHGINSMTQIKSLLGCFSCFNQRTPSPFVKFLLVNVSHSAMNKISALDEARGGKKQLLSFPLFKKKKKLLVKKKHATFLFSIKHLIC